MRSVFRCKVIACLMLLLGLCFGMAFSVYAEPVAVNETNFPDEEFRNWVRADYGNELDDDEINGATYIYIDQKAISSLKGIEFFKNLETLKVYDNLFESVDLSGNPKLENIDLSSNQKLKSIKFPQNTGTIKELKVNSCAFESLDVSGLTALTLLECDSNQLTELELNNNTALTSLDLDSNKLTKLDLTKNTALESLSCHSNQLTELELSKNTALTSLDCGDNQLKGLDLSKNTALGDLNCAGNQLTELDLSKNTGLTQVLCQYNNIREINITGLTELWYLSLTDNLLLSIDTSGKKKLSSTYIYSSEMKNRDMAVVEANGKYIVDFSGEKGWTGKASDYSFEDRFGDYANNKPVITDKGLEFSYDPMGGLNEKSFVLKYDLSNGYYLDGMCLEIPVTIKRASSFDNTTISVTKDNFPDERFRAYLINNYCQGSGDENPVIRVGDVDSICIYNQENLSLKGIELLTALTSLDCSHNQLTELDLSKNTSLTYLDCSDNQLTKLNLSNNTALTQLNCNGNQLKKLDLSGNTFLTSLNCCRNKLKEIDLSGNTALTQLNCNGNQLKKLDLSGNTALTSLDCSDNKIVELDITGLIELDTLDVGYNYLLSLDTSHNKKLSRDWDSKKILGVMNRRKVKVIEENGKFLVDFSKEKGWTGRASDYSIYEGDFQYESKPEITDKGLLFDFNPFSDETEDPFFEIGYDLSNGSGMEGFQMIIPVVLKDESYFSYGSIAVTEENFPDEHFRRYLIDNFCQDSIDENPVIEIGEVESLYLDSYNQVKSLKGIENFVALERLDLVNFSNLTELNLIGLKDLTDLSVYGGSLYALDLDESFKGYVYYSGSASLTAVESGGKFVLPIPEAIDLSSSRIFDISEEVEDNKIVWDKKEDIPCMVSYRYMLKGDYESGNEYEEGRDYIEINISVTNNAPVLPEGKVIELNETNFPDKKFRKILAEQYGIGKDKKTINTANIECLNIWDDEDSETGPMMSCKGIELLTNLREFSLYYMPVDEIDLSSNKYLVSVHTAVPALVKLNVRGCTYLERLNIDVSGRTSSLNGSSLTELDLTENKMLRELIASGNSLSEIDLSNNLKLTNLDLSNNALRKVDLRNNTLLRQINLHNNGLKELEIPKKNLRLLDIGGGYFTYCRGDGTSEHGYYDTSKNRLKKLDLNGCTKLEYLNITGNNITDFGTGDVFFLDELPSLASLYIDGQGGNLKELDLTKYSGLKNIFACAGEAEEFYVYIDYPSMTGLNSLSLSDVKLSKDGTEIDMDLSNSEKLHYLYLTFPYTDINKLNLEGLKWLWEVDYSGLYRQEYDPDTWETVFSGVRYIRNIEISDCVELENIYSTYMGAEKINIAGDISLHNLSVPDCHLKELDISTNRALQRVDCGNNEITELDTSNNKAIKALYLSGNPIRSLDLSNNKAILSTDCSNASLTSLDVSENFEMEELYASNQCLELDKSEIITASSVADGAKLNGTEQRLIKLSDYGNFDMSKVSDISGGTLVEDGIILNDGELPECITYKYKIEHASHLKNVEDMDVTIRFYEGKKGENGENGNKVDVSGNNLSDPYSSVHDTDGSNSGTLAKGSAKWEFNPLRSKTVVVVDKLDISAMFGDLTALPGYDPSAKHKFVVDNKKIATVNKKGILKPKNRGEITILLLQKNGKGWDSIGKPIHLYIQKPEMVKKMQVTASPGDRLNALDFLSKTTYAPTKWISTKSAVASIDDDGNITVNKKGAVKIIAVYESGGGSSKKKYATKLKIKVG